MRVHENSVRRVLQRERIERMQGKAVAFLRDVVGNDDLADEIEDLSLEDYAERKKILIANPRLKGGENIMATKRDLEEQIEELEERNQELEDTLAAIGESVNSALPEDEMDDEDGDADEDEND
jgi:hypothetical protein